MIFAQPTKLAAQFYKTPTSQAGQLRGHPLLLVFLYNICIFIYIYYIKKRNILRRRRGAFWYNICIFIYIYYIKNVTLFEEEGGGISSSQPTLAYILYIYQNICNQSPLLLVFLYNICIFIYIYYIKKRNILRRRRGAFFV